MSTTTKLSALAATAALLLAASACSTPAETPKGAAPASSAGASAAGLPAALKDVDKNAPLYNQLPDAIKTKGKIVVGSEIGYPPMEYYDADGKTVLGFDKTLSDLLSHELGVPMEWQNSNFDGLITQLDSGRIDIVMASMMDSKSRQAKADFVDYYEESSVLLGKAGAAKIDDLMDVCGKTVTVQRGTSQEDVMGTISDKCKATGKAAVDILPFDKESDALLQVKQGRAIATLESAAVAAYNVTQSKNAYEVLSKPVEGTKSLTGIATAKSNGQLRDAIAAGMKTIMANGSYDKALQQYGLTTGKLASITINAGQ